MAALQLARFAYRATTQLAVITRSPLVHIPTARCLSTTSTRLATDGHIINIQDEEDFKNKVLKSKIPVIVDFHADWCGPCKLLAPRLEKIIQDKKGKVILAKVDIDLLDEISMEYNVSSVPTVISVKDGVEKDRMIGLHEDDLIETFVEKSLM